MRVTGGQYRGIPLSGPKNDAIRPTSDKARLAVFNSLQSGRYDIDMDDAHVLDGTAGTGAMGIEALSRFADFVHFADPSREALSLVQQNLDKAKADKTTYHLHACKTESLPPSARAMAVVFLDPPYRSGALPGMIDHLVKNGWVDANTLLVIEDDRHEAAPHNVDVLDEKLYGAAKVFYARIPA